MLIDTLVALTILAIGFTSLIHLHTRILDLGARTKARAEALRLAEGKLEYLRYTVLLTHTEDWTVDGKESLTGSSTEFQLHWTASELEDLDERSFTVTVAWKTAVGAQIIIIRSRGAQVEPLATNLWFTSGI